jgi:hypothetical protein
MAKDGIILAFLYLFYIVKIIEKSLFSEGEIGFIGKITYQRRIRYSLNFLTLKTFESNRPWKKARPFSSLVILMRVNINR